MRNEVGEDNADGIKKGESDIRPTLRALGRSPSSKVKQGLDWNR